MKAKVFDGPGFEANEVITLHGRCKTSQFQAFVLLMYSEEDAQTVAEFCGGKISDSKSQYMSVFDQEGVAVLGSSTDLLSRKYIFRVNSPHGDQLKVFLHQIKLIGLKPFECLYGGLSVIEEAASEVLCICDNSIFTQKHMYTGSSEIMLRPFWF